MTIATQRLYVASFPVVLYIFWYMPTVILCPVAVGRRTPDSELVLWVLCLLARQWGRMWNFEHIVFSTITPYTRNTDRTIVKNMQTWQLIPTPCVKTAAICITVLPNRPHNLAISKTGTLSCPHDPRLCSL